MLAAFVVHMTHEAMRGRKCIPAWRALPLRERLIFFGFVVAFNRWGRSTTWN